MDITHLFHGLGRKGRAPTILAVNHHIQRPIFQGRIVGQLELQDASGNIDGSRNVAIVKLVSLSNINQQIRLFDCLVRLGDSPILSVAVDKPPALH